MIYMASYVALGALATSDDLLPARHFQRKKQLIGHSAASAFLIAGSIVVAVQPQAAIFVTIMAFMNVYVNYQPAYWCLLLETNDIQTTVLALDNRQLYHVAKGEL